MHLTTLELNYVAETSLSHFYTAVPSYMKHDQIHMGMFKDGELSGLPCQYSTWEEDTENRLEICQIVYGKCCYAKRLQIMGSAWYTDGTHSRALGVAGDTGNKKWISTDIYTGEKNTASVVYAYPGDFSYTSTALKFGKNTNEARKSGSYHISSHILNICQAGKYVKSRVRSTGKDFYNTNKNLEINISRLAKYKPLTPDEIKKARSALEEGDGASNFENASNNVREFVEAVCASVKFTGFSDRPNKKCKTTYGAGYFIDCDNWSYNNNCEKIRITKECYQKVPSRPWMRPNPYYNTSSV